MSLKGLPGPTYMMQQEMGLQRFLFSGPASSTIVAARRRLQPFGSRSCLRAQGLGGSGRWGGGGVGGLDFLEVDIGLREASFMIPL